MKNAKRKLLSIVLSLVLIVSIVYVPAAINAIANDAAPFGGTLGKEWSLVQNGNASVPAAQFVHIVKEQKSTGASSLRIGHPTEATDITLRLTLATSSSADHTYSVYAMSTAAVTSAVFTLRNGENGVDDNAAINDVAASLTTAFTQFTGNLTISEGTLAFDVALKLDAGVYVYLDKLQIYDTANGPELNVDTSFERLNVKANGANSSTNYPYATKDFVNVVDTKANDGQKSLRIGNKDVATNITLDWIVPAPAVKSTNWYFTADMFVEGDGLNSGSYIYIANTNGAIASTSSGSGSKNYRRIILSDTSILPTGEWHGLTKSDYTRYNTNAAAASNCYNSGNYAYLQLKVVLDAGEFVYVDNLKVVNTKSSVNLFNDGSFENVDLYANDFTTTTESYELNNWVVTDNDGEEAQNFLTADATGGVKALAITAGASHTMANTVSGLTAGEAYVIEAMAKKSGEFNAARIFYNDGGSNTTVIDFNTATIAEYTPFTATFTPAADSATINIYTVGATGSLLMVDDIKIYKADDATKTNLLTNGSFESYVMPKTYDYFSGDLSSEWTCFENRNETTNYREFVDITENQSYKGQFSLKIGHKAQPTDMTLRFTLPVANGEYGYDARFKTNGAPLDGSAVILKNGEEDEGVSTSLTTLTDAWQKFEGTVAVDTLELVIDINVVLEAGEFIYVDYMNVYSTVADQKFKQLNTDASFERWYVSTNNKNESEDYPYPESEFVKVVTDKSSDGEKSLRIGHPTLDTDIVVNYVVPVIDSTTGRNDTFRLKADVYVEGDGLDSGSMMMYGYLGGVNYRRQLFTKSTTVDEVTTVTPAFATNEWVSLSNSTQVTPNSTSVNTNGPYMYGGDTNYTIRLIVKCSAGEYLYIDNLNVYNTADTANNLVGDASFENYELKQEVLSSDTTLTSALVMPKTWYLSSDAYYGYRFIYRSTEAVKSDYAMAIAARERSVNITLTQSGNIFDADVQYVLEGDFKKVGTFSSINLMETGSGLSNKSILQLSGTKLNEYTHLTKTFTGRGGKLSIYTVGKKGALLLIDNLTVYRADDETKTNLLKNGGFDEWSPVSYEQYRINKTFKTAPVTIEATIKLPADYDKTKEAGVITGNYNAKDEGINLEVTSYGRPRVYIYDKDGKQYDYVFDGINLLTGEWTHLAVVKNETTLDLYVDGVLAGSKECAVEINTAVNAYAISGDLVDDEYRMTTEEFTKSQPTNPHYFKGEIASVAYFDDARTADEIALDKAEYGEDGLIAAFDMFSTADPQIISATNECTYNALRYSNFISTLQEEDDDAEKWPYSFAVVGDIQYVNNRDVNESSNDLAKIFNWILAQREEKNIQFVMGLGDITDKCTTAQFNHAAEQYKRLNDAGLRQSIVRGNHDGVDFDDRKDDPTLYDELLGDIIKNTGYDGVMDEPEFDADGQLIEGSGSYDNTYYKVTVGEHKWLIFALTYYPTTPVLEWAGDVIEAHPDYKVILTTHGYLSSPVSSAAPGTISSAKPIWDELGSKYENIKLIICGHSYTMDVAYRKSVGVNGNVVTELQIDRQGLELSRSFGLTTLLRFSEDGSQIKVEDYAAVLGKYFRPSNQIVIDIDETVSANEAAYQNLEYWLGSKHDSGAKSHALAALMRDSKAAIDAIDPADSEALAAAVAAAKANINILENDTKTIAGGSQVRDNYGTNDIRFVLELDDSFYQYMNGKYENVEFGTIIARGDKYTGPLEYSEKTSGFGSTCATTIKRTSTFKPEEYTTLNSGETTVYTCVIRNIPESCFDVELRARTYLKYTDEDGVTRFVYGDEVSTTFNTVLSQAQ